MQIILVGCGKVGAALARRLSEEGHDITMIDLNADRIAHITEELDIMGIVGNGSSYVTLQEAGLDTADVFIAVTGSDELNLLCCMFAKGTKNCHCVARVRNPMYSRELEFIKQQSGISAIINPELTTAKEISQLLRFPAARKIDSFADGKVQMIKLDLQPDSLLAGMSLKEVGQRLDRDILICAVEREKEVHIPGGDFVLQGGDIITFVATPQRAAELFEKLGLPTRPVRTVMIVGGGTTGFYLAKDLSGRGVRVKLVDIDSDRCDYLSDELPGVSVLCGDGTDRQFLLSEGLPQAEAVVALTNIDEENILLSLYAHKHSDAKLVTKIKRLDFDDILDSMDVGSVIYPKYMTCDYIVQYVRALNNEAGNNIKTLYRLLDDRVEALEFQVQEESPVTRKTLAELSSRMRPGLLLCCIDRGGEIILPRGNDRIQVGDSVIVVTLEHGLADVRDILR